VVRGNSSRSTAVRPRTAVCALVPEAEAIVGPWRAKHDPSAAAGVPAHVTLLFPFAPLAAIAGDLEARLANAIAGHAPFAARFSSLRRWPGVLWLAPDDPAPLEALIAALARAFPDYPPYGGAHETITPHLTVADIKEAADIEAEVDRIERAFVAEARSRLPIQTTVTEVWLLAEEDGRWRTVRPYRLSGGP